MSALTLAVLMGSSIVGGGLWRLAIAVERMAISHRHIGDAQHCLAEAWTVLHAADGAPSETGEARE